MAALEKDALTDTTMPVQPRLKAFRFVLKPGQGPTGSILRLPLQLKL
jgi:hypothetical protein